MNKPVHLKMSGEVKVEKSRIYGVKRDIVEKGRRK